jgi:membrane-associated phospholipid phosphatase
LRAHWALKSFSIPVFIGIFFVGYFLLLRFPIFEVSVMPALALDKAIPFQPGAAFIYFSLWVYVSLAPALIGDRQELLFYGKMAIAMASVGLAIFLFWPTTILAGAQLNEMELGRLAWLKQVDAGGNACPSLHVAFAVFSGLWLDRSFTEMRLPSVTRVLNILWCGAIAYSTLATKQHVALDVLAGALLGMIAGSIHPARFVRKGLAMKTLV